MQKPDFSEEDGMLAPQCSKEEFAELERLGGGVRRRQSVILQGLGLE